MPLFHRQLCQFGRCNDIFSLASEANKLLEESTCDASIESMVYEGSNVKKFEAHPCVVKSVQMMHRKHCCFLLERTQIWPYGLRSIVRSPAQAEPVGIDLDGKATPMVNAFAKVDPLERAYENHESTDLVQCFLAVVTLTMKRHNHHDAPGSWLHCRLAPIQSLVLRSSPSSAWRAPAQGLGHIPMQRRRAPSEAQAPLGRAGCGGNSERKSGPQTHATSMSITESTSSVGGRSSGSVGGGPDVAATASGGLGHIPMQH
jgi:hypothetical protein